MGWPHRHQHRQVTAARLAGDADPGGIEPEVAGMRLQPADPVVDVDERCRVAVGAVPELERSSDDAVFRQGFIEALSPGHITAGPGAAMQIDDRGERPVAVWPVKTGDQPALAVAQIFDIFGGDFVSRHFFTLAEACATAAQQDPSGPVPHHTGSCRRAKAEGLPSATDEPVAPSLRLTAYCRCGLASSGRAVARPSSRAARCRPGSGAPRPSRCRLHRRRCRSDRRARASCRRC